MLFLKYPIPEFFWMGRVLSPRQQSVRYVFCIFFISLLFILLSTRTFVHTLLRIHTREHLVFFLYTPTHIHIQRVVNSYVEINLVVYDSR